MHNWLGRVFFSLIGLLVVAGLVLAFWPEPIGVDAEPVVVAELLVTVEEDGKTRIRDKYVVSAPLSGQLLRIEMDPGDTVAAGETLLAVIKPRDPALLDARAVAQAEANVAAAEAVLRRTAPALAQARLETANAESELGRVIKSAKGGGATASDVDAARTRYRQSVEEVRAALYAEEIAEFELEQARAALLRARPSEENNGAPDDWNVSIASPIDGRVLRVFQESAAVVTEGTPLLELGAPSDLEVEIDVLSSDAVVIEPGDRVLLEQWGGETPLEGRVRLVEPAGFTKISTLGVEEQRVNVIVDLVDPPEDRPALGDGFRVEARIVTDAVTDALCAPSSALFRASDSWAVFRIDDGRARLTTVEIGKRNGLQAEVLSGLEEGDRVVLHPSDQVVDGASLRPRN